LGFVVAVVVRGSRLFGTTRASEVGSRRWEGVDGGNGAVEAREVLALLGMVCTLAEG
jgi:hypothetical protein